MMIDSKYSYIILVLDDKQYYYFHGDKIVTYKLSELPYIDTPGNYLEIQVLV